MNGTLGTVSLYASPPLFQYKDYDGVCRMNADGTGTGSVGQQYDVYRREDNDQVDYRWCKEQCDANSECTGFEYRDSWDTSQCELWKEPISGHEARDDHICLVKVDHYYNSNSGVCRKYANGEGMGSNGNEYDLYRYKSYQWCMDTCSADKECTGIEHRYYPEDNQQCEIWHAEINSVLDKPYSHCDLKVQV